MVKLMRFGRLAWASRGTQSRLTPCFLPTSPWDRYVCRARHAISPVFLVYPFITAPGIAPVSYFKPLRQVTNYTEHPSPAWFISHTHNLLLSGTRDPHAAYAC